MTINNPKLFLEGFWDWGILDKCFGDSKIKPTDIDGIVEKNGFFLVLETKKPRTKIPSGQRIMFNRMRDTGFFTILILWGEKSTPYEIQIITRKKTYKKKETSLKEVRKIVSKWYKFASSKEGGDFCTKI